MSFGGEVIQRTAVPEQGPSSECPLRFPIGGIHSSAFRRTVSALSPLNPEQETQEKWLSPKERFV